MYQVALRSYRLLAQECQDGFSVSLGGLLQLLTVAMQDLQHSLGFGVGSCHMNNIMALPWPDMTVAGNLTLIMQFLLSLQEPATSS